MPSDVQERDGVELQLRVGLNSGQVIAGEIGSGPFGYTTIGEQVGMAQRMESVAPPGGVMLSASTARLVDGAAALGEPELVQIKGADEPVPGPSPVGHGRNSIARSGVLSRLWWVGGGRCRPSRACWTVRSRATVRSLGWWGLRGSVRAVWCARLRRWRVGAGVDVFTAFCESHTSQVPFHAVARLLRAASGVVGLDAQAARDAGPRPRFLTPTPRTWLLLRRPAGHP